MGQPAQPVINKPSGTYAGRHDPDRPQLDVHRGHPRTWQLDGRLRRRHGDLGGDGLLRRGRQWRHDDPGLGDDGWPRSDRHCGHVHDLGQQLRLVDRPQPGHRRHAPTERQRRHRRWRHHPERHVRGGHQHGDAQWIRRPEHRRTIRDDLLQPCSQRPGRRDHGRERHDLQRPHPVGRLVQRRRPHADNQQPARRHDHQPRRRRDLLDHGQRRRRRGSSCRARSPS